jgi:type III secretion system FlhB-like substrate exporter
MSTNTYSNINIKELISNAPAHILEIISSGEIGSTTIQLASEYDIPVGRQIALSNVITYILLGAVLPEDVVTALVDLVQVDETTATKIATDLNSSIFQKARNVMLNKEDEVKTLEYGGEKSKEELRKEIMDTTKRESAINKTQSSTPQKKTTILTPGSRSQLLEQLQVIGSIPDDEEISERLQHIQDQISSIKKQEDDNTLHSNIALKSFMFGDKGKDTVTATLRPATYSVAPKEYNVDPYREMSEGV